jgi:hypothetical protein
MSICRSTGLALCCCSAKHGLWYSCSHYRLVQLFHANEHTPAYTLVLTPPPVLLW